MTGKKRRRSWRRQRDSQAEKHGARAGAGAGGANTFPMLFGIGAGAHYDFEAALAPLALSFQSFGTILGLCPQGTGCGGTAVLGTDEYGRDLFSRIIWGAPVSLQVGLAAVLVAFSLGYPWRITAGFLGGRVEMTIMRLTDMLIAFPTLLLALVIVTALGASFANEILAIGVALTPNFVRLARSLALTIRENDYIVAARALGGAPGAHHVTTYHPQRHVHLVVIATLDIATAIRTEGA